MSSEKTPASAPVHAIVTTPSEVMAALDSGCRVFCEWEPRGPMHTMPGEVIRCQGNRVLVRHWADRWHVIGDRGFRLVAYPPIETKVPFHQWMKDEGNEWPNLGVNWPAGDSWEAAGHLTTLHRR